jgi:hypothetical protein
MPNQPDRGRGLLSRLTAPIKHLRSRSPTPKEADEADPNTEISIPAKSKLDPPATTAPHVSSGQTSHTFEVRTPKTTTIEASDARAAASHVSGGRSPSTSHAANLGTLKILLSSDTPAIHKHSGSTSSHSEKLDGSHRNPETSPGESGLRPTTISSGPSQSQTATINNTSDAGAAGSTSNLTNPYADLMGTSSTAVPSASGKTKSTMNVVLKGLKKALEMVERSSDVMPPLKSAAAAILSLWDVVEVCLHFYSPPSCELIGLACGPKRKRSRRYPDEI